MFTFDKTDIPESKIVSLDEIKAKVTDLEIFERYCRNFKQLNESFLSEFYNDTNPSCRIFRTNKGYYYKDFGTGEYYSCFDYVQRKFYCTFFEALNIIANDFKIKEIKQTITPRVIITNDLVFDSFKPKIEIISQPYNLVDYEYWKSYKIPLSLVAEYNVFSCSHVFLKKRDKIITFEYSRNNPMYAYRFTYEGEYYYKIYKPLETNKKYKWLFSGTKECIEGEDQLPLFGDLLILTKSLKDCMCYNLLGIPAISLQGEGNRLEEDTINRVLKRFKTIIVNYDNDEEGRRGSQRLMQQMGFKSFFIDKPYKDLADYMKEHTIEEAKIMITNKINEK